MSWTVHIIENSAKVPRKVAEEFAEKFKKQLDFLSWIDNLNDPENKEQIFNEIFCGKYLNLTEDHSEHIDWLTDKMCTFLAANKVKGNIKFGALEGDNAGSFWGYSFDGAGGWKKIKGELVWS